MMNQIQGLYRRVQGFLRGDGAISRVDDTGAVQIVQITHGTGELYDNVPSVMHYGYASHPPKDTRAIALSMAGDAAQKVVIGTVDPTRRKNLPEGAVCLYHKDGNTVVMLDDGEVRINADKVIIDADEVEIKGKLTVTGDIVSNGDVKAGSVSLTNHRHPETGSTTGTPI